MNAKDAIRKAAKNAGVPLSFIGQALGLNRSAVSACRQNLGALTVASFAAVCGYSLALIPSSDIPSNAIIIEPDRKPSDDLLMQAKQRERDALARKLAALDEELIG